VERVGKAVLNAAFKVHTALGPGSLESVYEICTASELTQSGLCAPIQVALPLTYQGIKMDAGLRLDMIVEECVIVEFKSVETIHPIFEAQLITYLKLTGIRLGFLMNFNVLHLKDGIKRIVV
jgi:GxxExxY protein